jgi:hypothetical protein
MEGDLKRTRSYRNSTDKCWAEGMDSTQPREHHSAAQLTVELMLPGGGALGAARQVLTTTELAVLGTLCRVQSVHTGDTLYRMGEPAHWAYFLAAGNLELRMHRTAVTDVAPGQVSAGGGAPRWQHKWSTTISSGGCQYTAVHTEMPF